MFAYFGFKLLYSIKFWKAHVQHEMYSILAENPAKDRRGIFAPYIKILWNNAHFSSNCRNFVKLNQNNGFCNTRLLLKPKAFHLPRSRHMQIKWLNGIFLWFRHRTIQWDNFHQDWSSGLVVIEGQRFTVSFSLYV